MNHSDSDIPNSFILPVIPVKNTVLFPEVFVPLLIGRPKSVAAVEEAMNFEDKHVLVIAQKEPLEHEPNFSSLYHIGTKAVIRKMTKSDDSINLVVQGIERVRLLSITSKEPCLHGKVVSLPPPQDMGPEIEALQRAIIDQAKRISKYVETQAPSDFVSILTRLEDPLHQIYTLVSIINFDVKKAQSVLEAGTRLEALKLAHSYLEYELQVLELRGKIASEAASKMSKEQRNYFLRQQLKAIKEELGESSETEDQKIIREKLEKAKIPEEVKPEVEREFKRLERLSDISAEYQVVRSYLELVAELPWDEITSDDLDIENARKVLDEDHYNLKDVKERILEHLAVLKLNPVAKAPILCFVGPPGVGKTSLGRSIARALGRRFERMSLGGLHDEAELRGHRRTYVGAMPGRIIQAIRRAKVKNPVLMLDEVDKLGRDFRGDPAAALMEILDPEQNFQFRDNYLDLPFDLSKVFFIVTANTLETIPTPLLDRLEILRLSGYTDEEKIQIATKYLMPSRIKDAGINSEELIIPQKTILKIINRYTREAGLRELDRSLAKIVRKIAYKFAKDKRERTIIEENELNNYLGPERFFMEKARQKMLPGVAAGLAWTVSGGEVLYVEASLLPSKEQLILTGQLGEVMKESARIALSFVLSSAKILNINLPNLAETSLHLHVPAGAVPKDGPSAGLTMATAIISLLTNTAVADDIAMTGEITLAGLVLPVGGIKEKLLAASRALVKTVILPEENRKDLQEVPESVRESLNCVFVKDVFSAWKIALKDIKI